MTNPGTPTSGGGMPKWLIILLVVFLVVMLGCCGGFTTCWFLARRAARTGMPAFQQWAQDTSNQIQAQAKAAQAQAEAQARAANGGAAPVVTPGADNGTPGAATPAGGSTPLVTQKMPGNFPADVPVLDGLTTTMSTADMAKGGGVVMMSGKNKPDDVVAFYTKGLEKAGYTQTQNTVINGITQVVYTKDSNDVLVQVTPGDGGGSNVMITYSKK